MAGLVGLEPAHLAHDRNAHKRGIAFEQALYQKGKLGYRIGFPHRTHKPILHFRQDVSSAHRIGAGKTGMQ